MHATREGGIAQLALHKTSTQRDLQETTMQADGCAIISLSGFHLNAMNLFSLDNFNERVAAKALR